MPISFSVITDIRSGIFFYNDSIYCWLLVRNKVHLHFTLALRLNFASWSEGKSRLALYQRIGRLTDVDLANLTAALHTTCRVHRIAPDVVLEFLHAYEPAVGGCRADTGSPRTVACRAAVTHIKELDHHCTATCLTAAPRRIKALLAEEPLTPPPSQAYPSCNRPTGRSAVGVRCRCRCRWRVA